MRFIKSGEGEFVKGQGYNKKVLQRGIDLVSAKALVQFILIDSKTEVKPHYHKKTTEAFYFLEGEGIFGINNKEILCSPGDFLICESNEIHSTKNNSGRTWKYIAFKIDVAENDLYWVKD